MCLNELKKKNDQTLMSLYQSLKNTGMSFGTFILCLDWLYLIDAAEVDEEGCINLCI